MTDEEDGHDREGLNLDMSDLSPEEALRGFMEVDPEKVKERLADGNTKEEGGDPS